MSNALKEFGFNIVSEGTDNHLILIDLTNTKYTGKEAEAILGEINITVNKNSIPNEQRSPFVTSGIRIGTAAITTRGFDKNDMVHIAEIFRDVLLKDEYSKEEILNKVNNLCSKHPLY